MGEFVSIAIKISIGVLTVLGGMVAYVWNSVAQDLPLPDLAKWVVGPFGALIMLLIAVSVLYKYLREKEKRIEALNKEMLEKAREDAEFWKKKALDK